LADNPVYQKALTMLNEELEYEQEIKDRLADLERMKQDFLKLRK